MMTRPGRRLLNSADPAVPLLREPGLAALPGVVHGFSERAGGVSSGRYATLNLGPRSGDSSDAVRENRRRLLAALGLDGRPVLAPRQTHSAEVAVIRAADPEPERTVFDGDGIVTDRRDGALVVLAADCVPVLLFDPERKVVAAVHAGWRGTAGGIAARAVIAMRDAFGCNPARIYAALGPAIGRCCYEVGPEVLAAVAAATPAPPETLWEPLPGDKGMLDLVSANIAQLRGVGVVSSQVRALGLCTACYPERFFSHRREGEPTGRAGAVIALLP